LPGISALIFPFHGVILDTESFWNGKWNRSIGVASGTFDVYSHLSELSGRDIDRVAMWAEIRGWYLAQIDANPVMPGVVDYISSA